jgi:type 1 glutamine amidotransferase
MLQFPALRGIPNPWQHNEEWYNFNSFQQWSGLPGFRVLGRKQADNQPIMWVRELNNWRSFYTALGHDSTVFRDPLVKQHVTGGILWTVRRDHVLPN